ncbi:MAG: beta strand repeat-containing protein [Gammaproteobacteria bacterium]
MHDLTARARAQRKRHRRIAVRTVTLTVGIAVAPGVLADPSGGTIVGGSGTLGGTPGDTVITQTSSRLAIDWRSFSIGAGERTEFRQPDASAVALNRVVGGAPSEIHGQLSANGQVYLVNPGGVLFGKGAQVDVRGLVASTLDIPTSDFMAGRTTFTETATGAAVVNEGRLTAADGGYVALIGRRVVNSGTINAPGGTAVLAAGEQVSLSFDADSLVDVAVERAALDALVENGGAIRAAGGTVVLTAHARDALLDTVVNNTGVIEADSVDTSRGVVRLGGGDDGVVTSSGTLAARGDNAGEAGGTVEITGRRIALIDAAVVDARGDAGGGSIHIGGSEQGEGPLPNSEQLFVGSATRVEASAGTQGDGGRVILYADDAARIHGRIAATGGTTSGAGGFVETSGKRSLEVTEVPDVTAPFGAPGTWLIDPLNIVIVATAGTCVSLSGCVSGPDWTATGTGATLGANLITAALNAGQNVTITTGDGGSEAGNITLSGSPVIQKSSGAADVTLTMRAHNDIGITAPISRTGGAGVGRLNVELVADSDASGTGNVALRAAVTTGGGTITASGQSISVLSGLNTNGTAGRDGGAITLAAQPTGSLNISGGTITASAGSSTGAGRRGGDVTLTGGTVTTRAITANGGNAGGTNQPGGQAGAITLDATGAAPLVTLNGNLTARGGNATGSGTGGAGGSITSADPITLGAAVTLATAGGTGGTAGTGGDVTVPGIDSGASARRNFTVNAGTGRFSAGTLGGTTPLGAVNITANGGVTTGDITTVGRNNEAGFAVTLNAGTTGAVSVGNITTRGTTASGVGRNGGAVTLTGRTLAPGAIDTSGSTAASTGVGGNGGAVSLTASGAGGGIALTRNITANGGNGVARAGGASGTVTVNGPVTLGNDVAIRSIPGTGTANGTAGGLNFGPTGTIDSDSTPRNLELDGRGGVTLQGPLGQNAPLANLTVRGNGPMTLPATTLLGDLAVTTDGAIADAGPQRVGGDTALDAGTGAITLDDPANDFTGPVSAQAGGAVTLNDANGLQLGNITSGGALTATANGDLRLAPGTRLNAGGDVVLAARGGNFINESDAGAITTPGRWLIYATSPAGNVPNGLSPGNPQPNLYNRTRDTAPPASIGPGNHFVFSVQPRLTVTADPAGKIFGDADPALTFAAAGLLAGDALADAFTGTFARAPGEDVGPYAIDAVGAGSAIGYAIDVVPGTFTIDRRPITLTVDPAAKVFGDADPALGFAVTAGSLAAIPGGALGGALTRAAGETVGSYAITQGTLDNPNYAITFIDGALAVTPRPITLAADDRTRIYGDPDPALGFSVTGGSLVATPEGTLSGAIARAAGEDVGRYAIGQGTLANGNYAITFVPGNFDITPRPLSLTADPAAKIFGDADPVFGFTVTAGSLAAIPGGALTGALGRAAGETVGSYVLNQGTLGNPNYAITFAPASLDITPRAVTLAANPANKRYGDPDPALGFTVTAGSLAAIPEGAMGGALARAAGEDVGSYAISQGTLGNPNYVLTFTPGTFDVIPRPLEVRARDASRLVGAADPEFGSDIFGFAFGEDRSVLGGTLVYTTTASAASGPGAFVLSPSGLTAANYVLIFVDGTLFVLDPAAGLPGSPGNLPGGPSGLPGGPASLPAAAGGDEAVVAARQNRPGLPTITGLARLDIIDEGIRLPPDAR